MTIINQANDGLYSQLIVLFRAVAYSVKIEEDELIRICSPNKTPGATDLNNLRGALTRWVALGLFQKIDSKIQLDQRYVKEKGVSIDELTNKLPSFCRVLILQKINALPLWGEKPGVASDFVRGISWLLAQDIYGFPTSWKDVQVLENTQILGGEKIIQNDTRWIGLRPWARYLGFATGEGSSFQIDPTMAIKTELPRIFDSSKKELPAKDFLDAMSAHIPVLDNGVFRMDVEGKLNTDTWRKPSDHHLSMALSLALRRLELSNEIKLAGKADAGSSFRLTGKNYRTGIGGVIGFESVIWTGRPI